ncbi:MAG: zinc protease [Lentimonas sp.]|jgi:zinc protease
MKKGIIVLAALLPAMVFGQLDRSIRPKPAAAPAINIKDSEVFKTKNGITVILSENHKIPSVSFDFVMGSDIKAEGGKAGLSDIAGSLIMSGTSNRDKDALDGEIDYIGARLSADNNSIFLSCLTKHMDKGLTLMSDVVMNANFPESEFERIIKQNESGIKSAKSDPASMARNAQSKANFDAAHPYSEVMTEETLKNITLADVKSYFKSNFTPKGSYLVVVGDINKEMTMAMVDKYFTAWTGGNVFENNGLVGSPNSGTRVLFVKKPGAVQSAIQISFPMSIKPGDQDQIALSVLNKILGGGGFGTRLMQNLREDKAYTYGCYSSLDVDENGSILSAGGNFRNDVTDSAITQIMYEISRITEEYISDEELSLTKMSMAGSFARSLERPQTIARFALNITRDNLPKDYYQTYLKKLDAVTKEDVLLMAQKYFTPKNANIIVVGNEEVLPSLMPFDKDGEIEMLDAFGNEVKDTKPADITADELLENVVLKSTQTTSLKAAAKKLKKVKSHKRVFDLTSPQIPIPLTMTEVWIKPNVSGQKLEGQGMTLQKVYFDGKSGSSTSMQAGTKELTTEEVTAKAKSMGLIPELNYKMTGMDYEIKGIEMVDGQEAYVLQTKDGQAESLDYYDKNTFMKVKTITTSKEGEDVVTQEMTYGDYKEIEGIMLPNKMSLSVGPMTLDGIIKTQSLNDKIDIEKFK